MFAVCFLMPATGKFTSWHYIKKISYQNFHNFCSWHVNVLCDWWEDRAVIMLSSFPVGLEFQGWTYFKDHLANFSLTLRKWPCPPRLAIMLLCLYTSFFFFFLNSYSSSLTFALHLHLIKWRVSSTCSYVRCIYLFVLLNVSREVPVWMHHLHLKHTKFILDLPAQCKSTDKNYKCAHICRGNE